MDSQGNVKGGDREEATMSAEEMVVSVRAERRQAGRKTSMRDYMQELTSHERMPKIVLAVLVIFDVFPLEVAAATAVD